MVELENSKHDDYLIQIFRINNDDNKNNPLSKSVISLPPIKKKNIIILEIIFSKLKLKKFKRILIIYYIY